MELPVCKLLCDKELWKIHRASEAAEKITCVWRDLRIRHLALGRGGHASGGLDPIPLLAIPSEVDWPNAKCQMLNAEC